MLAKQVPVSSDSHRRGSNCSALDLRTAEALVPRGGEGEVFHPVPAGVLGLRLYSFNSTVTLHDIGDENANELIKYEHIRRLSVRNGGLLFIRWYAMFSCVRVMTYCLPVGFIVLH